MFSFFRGRERETGVKKREKDIKNETSVGERKIGRERERERERERTTEREKER